MDVNVAVSKRHVHLTEETYEKLFGNTNIEVRNYLSQEGEFASKSTVDLEWNGKIINHVRVVGPFRKYNQVEISKDECDILEVNPPIRKSGDLSNSLPINVLGPKDKVLLDSAMIMAERHLHLNNDDALKLGVSDGDKLSVYKDNNYLFDVHAKVSDNGVLEIHIDTYEEKLYNIHQGDTVKVVLCGK